MKRFGQVPTLTTCELFQNLTHPGEFRPKEAKIIPIQRLTE